MLTPRSFPAFISSTPFLVQASVGLKIAALYISLLPSTHAATILPIGRPVCSYRKGFPTASAAIFPRASTDKVISLPYGRESVSKEALTGFFQSIARLFSVGPSADLKTERQGLWGELFLMQRVRGVRFL